MKKDWFEDWFNSSYYHSLYQHRDYKEACLFIDKLCDHLAIPKNAEILDLACGKGRHALHLGKKGFQATGVDLAAESIKLARINAPTNVHFDVHDMRFTYREKGFDFVFNLFTSFGYFKDKDENLKVLQAAAKNLKDEGTFVLDFMNAKKVIANLVAEEQKNIDGIQFNIGRHYNGQHIIKDIEVVDGANSKQFQERVYAFDLISLQELAQNVGLQIVDVFGDYQLNDFNALESDRLILLMKSI